MAKLLVTGTHASDDGTRAIMPFHVAKGAIEAGHQVSITLMADGPMVLKNDIRDGIVGIAVPPLKDLLQFAIEKGVRVYVWGGCAKARGVSEADLSGKNAEFIDPKRYAQLVFEHDRVVTFWASGSSSLADRRQKFGLSSNRPWAFTANGFCRMSSIWRCGSRQ